MANITAHNVTLIEESRVSPPPGTVEATSLPLNFFDIPNLSYTMPSLIFYKHSNPDPNILIPTLKHSLSLTLKHFIPVAGNLVLYDPTGIKRHEIRYTDGDFVELTFVTCDSNFDDLAAKNPIHVTELLPFTPRVSHSVVSAESIVAPVLAIQVTIFQDHGICIGITREHVIGDVSTFVRFVRAWALINKTSSDKLFLASNLIPSFDRSVVIDSKDLYNLFSSQATQLYKKLKAKYQNYNIQPEYDTFRGTFVITQAEIHRLKKMVLDKSTSLPHISSFVVASAYIWSCIAKLNAVCEDGKKVEERWGCVASLRQRVSTIPENFFGNCYLPCGTSIDRATLVGKNGVIVAAEKIGEAISKLVNNEEGILEGAEKWFADVQNNENRLWMGGSPKYSTHDIDFGWGIPRKTHYGYYEEGIAMLNGYSEPQGGFETGLTFSKDNMDIFARIFKTGLDMGK